MKFVLKMLFRFKKITKKMSNSLDVKNMEITSSFYKF